jgi:uncharacterized Fe-S cluster-containing radical SAM superfamily protein
MYDPLALTEKIKKSVVRGTYRRYYRLVRGGRWYGGIATADCCGCQLRCVFCWSDAPRDHPDRIGKFYEPTEVFNAITSCAKKHGYKQLRVSGNEPTLGKEHLLELLKMVDRTQYMFILETNGILIDKEYARGLSKFRNLHVRVSIKGTTPDEFSRLTGAMPEAFQYQLNALQNLIEFGVSCHPAVMLSFSSKENFKNLRKEIKRIAPYLEEEIEEEYVFFYPHVVKRLKKAGIKPIVAYDPNGIPKELI